MPNHQNPRKPSPIEYSMPVRAQAALMEGPKTSDFYMCHSNLPRRFECPESRRYKPKDQHPMYMTTSNMYGYHAPTVHEMPTKFFGQSSKFTELMGSRLSRDFGLNH